MDFANTNSNLPKSQTIGIGVAQSFNAIEAKGRTRLVLGSVVDLQGRKGHLALQPTACWT